MLTQYVQEGAAKLAAKNADGSYPVVIITEGVGSSGIYPAELMSEDSARLFENVPSFMDHPEWASAPHERSVLKIGGRVRNVKAGVSEGKAALLGDYTPREEYAKFVEEFHDIIALSIYSLAEGHRNEEDVFVVDAFTTVDPYRSVDVVIAGGRGGKFARAEESLRTIESSLGTPGGIKPGSTSAPGTHTQEESMDQKQIEEAVKAALVDALKPISDFLAEEGARRQAEADAAAGNGEVSEAVEAAITAVEAIRAAKVLPKLEAKLIESAKKGADVTADLDYAKEVTAEAQTFVAGRDSEPGYIHESSNTGDDFSLNIGGRR